MPLSSLDINAIYAMQKRGEMMLDESGEYYRSTGGFGSLERKRVEKLAAAGYFRIDQVGASTFAVFVKGPDAN